MLFFNLRKGCEDLQELSTLNRMFKRTMQREGKTVSALIPQKDFTAFFRNCSDGKSTENRINIYYGIDAPVEQGSLIKYKTKTYILINKETEENDCYYKSLAIACNGMLRNNKLTVKDVPVYGYDMNDGVAYTGNTFTVINGYMELITQDTDAVRKLEINDTFNIFGRTFKIDNIYYKDGICHIIAKVGMDEEDPKPTPEPEPPTNENRAVIESTDTPIRVGGSRVMTVKVTDQNGTDVTADYESNIFKWTCKIDGVDATSDVTLTPSYKGNFNQCRIQVPAGHTEWFAKTLTVSCKIVNTNLVATRDYELAAYL